MLFQDLNNKKIGIWGKGKEGLSAQNAIEKYTSATSVTLFDDSDLSGLFDFDVVITSPGVSLYRPEIQQAKQRGVCFTTGTDLFLSNRPQNSKIVGITGTKGKSTTTSLLYHLLNNSGYVVELAGNIGKPLLDLLGSKTTYIIVELSSYQCASLTRGCDVGVILNLYPEHLQWHLTHQNYYSDKCRLAELSTSVIANRENETLVSLLNNHKNVTYYNDVTGIHIRDNSFYQGTKKIVETDVLNLKGIHNAQNACAVLSVLDKLNIQLTPEQIASAFQTMSALPHRLQTVGTYAGRTFIDDSISTTPQSAIAAVKAMDNGQPITLIVGGFDRGQVYHELIEYVLSIKSRISFIALPDTGTRLYEEAKINGLNAFFVENMYKAIQSAYKITPIGGTVILSPAAPSYNSYRNFEERGQDFKDKIISLEKEFL